MTVRSSQDVEKISKAWRVASGTFYKVELRCRNHLHQSPVRPADDKKVTCPRLTVCRRQLVCDMQHAFSCKVWLATPRLVAPALLARWRDALVICNADPPAFIMPNPWDHSRGDDTHTRGATLGACEMPPFPRLQLNAAGVPPLL